jgi:hypothetical protein
VFLLDDQDVARYFKRPQLPISRERARAAVVAVFAILSLVEASNTFAHTDFWPQLSQKWAPFRLVNTYHLFGSITRERIEPEFQTEVNGAFSPHDLHYKPGEVKRRPPYVAPHQPRVDFQLWFYGLSFRHRSPEYVVNLLSRLCHDPSAVQPLFVDRLPEHPEAVRIVYWQYHFASWEERAKSGAYWTRTVADETRPIACDQLP